jgi:hypothetical protein
MVDAGRMLFGDWTNALLDVGADASCAEGSLICGLRDAFDSAVVWTAALMLCVLVGFLLAVSFAVLAARVERARSTARASRRRVLSNPVHTDGAWVRLVEDERGRRIVEVLADGVWTPSTRGLAQFAIDVPTMPRSRG